MESNPFFLRNSFDTVAEIANPGLVLKSLKVPLSAGEFRELVLGFEDVCRYDDPAYFDHNYPYLGAFIGRYANRISGSRFRLADQEYLLHANDGDQCLHGGSEGFDRKVWKIDQLSACSLQASYLSKAGEEGFPGNLEVNVYIELSEDNELIMKMDAKSDAPTPVNLTWHPYFNLSGNTGNVADHIIQLNASTFLEQFPDACPTGTISSVHGTTMDFREPKSLNPTISEGGIDTSFIIDKAGGSDLARAGKIIAPDSKVSIEIWTDAPVVHLYTGQHLPDLELARGRSIRRFSGLCMECQQYTNAVNIAHFPTTILLPGQILSQTIAHKIFTD